MGNFEAELWNRAYGPINPPKLEKLCAVPTTTLCEPVSIIRAVAARLIVAHDEVAQPVGQSGIGSNRSSVQVVLPKPLTMCRLAPVMKISLPSRLKCLRSFSRAVTRCASLRRGHPSGLPQSRLRPGPLGQSSRVVPGCPGPARPDCRPGRATSPAAVQRCGSAVQSLSRRSAGVIHGGVPLVVDRGKGTSNPKPGRVVSYGHRPG